MSEPPPKPLHRPNRQHEEPKIDDADEFDFGDAKASGSAPKNPTLPDGADPPTAVDSKQGSLATAAPAPARPATRPPRPARPVRPQPAPATGAEPANSSELKAHLEALDTFDGAKDANVVKQFQDAQTNLDIEGIGGPTSSALGYPALGPQKVISSEAPAAPQKPLTRPVRKPKPSEHESKDAADSEPKAASEQPLDAGEPAELKSIPVEESPASVGKEDRPPVEPVFAPKDPKHAPEHAPEPTEVQEAKTDFEAHEESKPDLEAEQEPKAEPSLDPQPELYDNTSSVIELATKSEPESADLSSNEAQLTNSSESPAPNSTVNDTEQGGETIQALAEPTAAKDAEPARSSATQKSRSSSSEDAITHSLISKANKDPPNSQTDLENHPSAEKEITEAEDAGSQLKSPSESSQEHGDIAKDGSEASTETPIKAVEQVDASSRVPTTTTRDTTPLESLKTDDLEPDLAAKSEEALISPTNTEAPSETPDSGKLGKAPQTDFTNDSKPAEQTADALPDPQLGGEATPKKDAPVEETPAKQATKHEASHDDVSENKAEVTAKEETDPATRVSIDESMTHALDADHADPLDSSAKPPRPLRRPEVKPKPVPKPKPKSALASRFEAALRENEAPKPKLAPKPKPRDGAISGRMASIQASMFANLNEALSRGPPPSGRPRFGSSDSQESPAELSADNENDPARKVDAANESAETQIQAMPKQPRARSSKPMRSKRLPEAAKPTFSIVVAAKPLWELPASKVRFGDSDSADKAAEEDIQSNSRDLGEGEETSQSRTLGGDASTRESKSDRYAQTNSGEVEEPIEPVAASEAGHIPENNENNEPKDALASNEKAAVEGNVPVAAEAFEDDAAQFPEPTVETKWIPDRISQAVPSERHRKSQDDGVSDSNSETHRFITSRGQSPPPADGDDDRNLEHDTERDLRDALHKHLSVETSEEEQVDSAPKKKDIVVEDLPPLGTLIDRAPSPHEIKSSSSRASLEHLISAPQKPKSTTSVSSLNVPTLSQYLDKSPQNVDAPSGWDRMPNTSRLDLNQAQGLLKDMTKLKQQVEADVKRPVGPSDGGELAKEGEPATAEKPLSDEDPLSKKEPLEVDPAPTSSSS